MSYGRRQSSAKDRISREEGLELLRLMRIHDDGFSAHGGRMATIVGPRGSGKTTFEIQMAEGVCHLPHAQKDRDHITKTYPETVVWRGRQYEYFNTMFPSWWESETQLKAKPVFIHMAEGCEYKFYCDIPGAGRHELDLDETEIIYYKDIEQLVKENIVKRAINIVFEPKKYIIPADTVKEFSLKRLQFKPQPVETLADEDEEEAHPKRYKKKKREFVDTEAPSPLFWYEFVDKLMKFKNREDFYTIQIDESSDVFPKTVMSEWFHMVSFFSKSIADMRRFNISLFLATHEIGFVFYEIRRMSDFMIYMPGSRPDKEFTRVNWTLPTILNIGEFIIEIPMTKFGLTTFPRLNQAPLITVEGMTNL